MKLIDVEQVFCADCEYRECCEEVFCDVHSMPTVDAEPVVRCKDCNALYRGDERYVQHCCLTGTQVDDMDFCSYGKRRGEDGT